MKSNNAKSKIKSPLVKSSNPFPVIGIGASAGGLEAFKKLLKAIPENSGMAYVLLQHLNPKHESLLPELLQKVTRIPVLEIADDIKVEADHIYITPSNRLLVANDGVLQLTPRPAKNIKKLYLPIDLFFSSLAEVYEDHAIGVVLSGTASDGTQGLKAIKDNGGITFAQDEKSAAFEGMPGSAVHAGVVDFILPPEKIPQKIIEVTGITNGKKVDDEDLPQPYEEAFRQILSLLRIRKGTDFTYYKQTTIRRRILRRMGLNKNEDPAVYLKFLRENKKEQDILYQDLLIPVTSFFRDQKSFDNLLEAVFPRIVESKPGGDIIRIWVAGCSTGEEAYSIAIYLKEYLDNDPGKVQVFATDISEPAIAKARAGIYTKSEVAMISPQRLQEFFTKTDGGYRVKKHIREMCVFAVHNFLKDPPFGKMDLISCRNVLIYMESYLQKKALTTFHYALNPEGFLLLGKSETSSSVSNLYAPAVKSDKIFSRKDMPGKFMVTPTKKDEQNFRDLNNNFNNEITRNDFQKISDEIMLSKFAPAGVVVNEAMDIVHFRGSTANYLEQASGKPSHNLLKMAKQGLTFELRNILHKAKKEKAPVIKENISIQVNGSHQKISIEAIPLSHTIEPHYLILFHQKQSSSLQVPGPKTKLKKDEKDLLIQQLEKDLAQSREDMRSITEDQEASNEELQSANEELLSGSEELQSLNEELETSKEELQSTNEELTVVNNELISLNELVTEARNFSDSIIANLREPFLVLDKSLKVITANNAFYKTFLVNKMETEGRLIYETGNNEWDIPDLRSMLEKALPEKTNIKDFEVRRSFSTIGERIMLLNAQEIIKESNAERLILVSIEDITEAQLARHILDEKNTALEKMNKELQSFAYEASHDLQEPLRKIRTFAAQILEKETENLSEKGKDYFHRMEDAAIRMHILIQDLLTFARITTTEQKFEKTDLNKLVEEVKEELKESVEEKGGIIEVHEMCEANIIPTQFRQLLINLVANSLKFSRPNTPPHITIKSAIIKYRDPAKSGLSLNNLYCHISITDNGIGFEKEFSEKIFEVFQRLHGRKEYAGTGIGLAIVKKIVNNHKGIITATGKLNKGAKFDIYIPSA